MGWIWLITVVATWAGIAAMGRRKGWSGVIRHGGGFVAGVVALAMTMLVTDSLLKPAMPVPQTVVAAQNSKTEITPVDYRVLASLTSAAITRSMQLFSTLGDSDNFIYYRDIYSPVSYLLGQWPVYYAPEAKGVPEALMDCREAASNWILYLGRATHKNPPEVVLRSAEKDLAKTKEKLQLCDAALDY